MIKIKQIILSLSVGMVFLSGCSSGNSEMVDVMAPESNSAGQEERYLAPCPDKPNCVVSEGSEGRAAIDPIVFAISPERMWSLLHQFVEESGGTIESETDFFLHATYRSKVFGFVDDITCRIDQTNNVLHIRSASRTGYYDFGVNRGRLERMRQFFARQEI